MKYRTEWKYICSEHMLDLLKPRISAVLGVDSNANQEIYNIHSLYFDDYRNSCAFDNDAGASERSKWRIRYYDDDTGFMKLERKRKHTDLCYKEASRLRRDQYDSIMNNDISKVLWGTEDRLVKEFCIDIMTKQFRPKIIIDYERTAFVDPILNVRITFDKNICGSLDIDRFMERTYLKFPVQEKGEHVLEVKFDDLLPSHIERMLHASDLQRNTFSKYYLGRLVLERNLL